MNILERRLLNASSEISQKLETLINAASNSRQVPPESEEIPADSAQYYEAVCNNLPAIASAQKSSDTWDAWDAWDKGH